MTSYVQKKLYGKNEYNGVLPPFSLMSKGLGLRYCLEHKEALLNSDYLTYRGKFISVPRYFSKKLDLPKFNNVPRLTDLSNKLGYDLRYVFQNCGPFGLSLAIYNDKRVLGSLHQVNKRLKGSLRSKK